MSMSEKKTPTCARHKQVERCIFSLILNTQYSITLNPTEDSNLQPRKRENLLSSDVERGVGMNGWVGLSHTDENLIENKYAEEKYTYGIKTNLLIFE